MIKQNIYFSLPVEHGRDSHPPVDTVALLHFLQSLPIYIPWKGLNLHVFNFIFCSSINTWVFKKMKTIWDEKVQSTKYLKAQNYFEIFYWFIFITFWKYFCSQIMILALRIMCMLPLIILHSLVPTIKKRTIRAGGDFFSEEKSLWKRFWKLRSMLYSL